ncbi:MAG: methyltransferase domain-containing protein [Acidobacteriia bacterium]|nr:methyltransferase domain-containing protein [Terriglobia bacterium]MBV8902868.1 methyltransferase domain-containing protein [Terriglobia bacterium]
MLTRSGERPDNLRIVSHPMSGTDALFERYYYAKPAFLNGTAEFHNMIAGVARPNARILEIGAGPSNKTSRFLASLGALTGVDVSDEVLANDALARARVSTGSKLPFSDETFDVCVSNFVLEHVEDPQTHFREVARVLAPGGVYCFRTPNLWHYVAFISRVLPHNFHLKYANRLRNREAGAHDPYPTFYRSNTRRRAAVLSKDAGLEIVELRMVEKEPSYAKSSRLLFWPLLGYERMVNAHRVFEGVRANIFGVVSKNSSGR